MTIRRYLSLDVLPKTRTRAVLALLLFAALSAGLLLAANAPAANIAALVGAEVRTGAGLCLDVHAPDIAKDGGRVQVWACSGQAQQRWSYDSAASAVRISSGLCLDVHAPDMTKNGGRVQVWACNGAQQQQWTPLANGALRNAGGLCLDVHAPDQAKNGGRVQVWQCSGAQQQRFTSSIFNAASPGVAGTGKSSTVAVEPGESVTVEGNTARISNTSTGISGTYNCTCSGTGKCTLASTPSALYCSAADGPTGCKEECTLSSTTTGARPSVVIQ